MKSRIQKIRILNQYDVLVGVDLIQKLDEFIEFEKYSKVFVITDSNLEKFHLETIKKSTKVKIEKIVFQPGEENKNIETTQQIWNELLRLGADRKSLVINLGGGVLGDLGGFAASTYMRGISFFQIPTTLLAQVDASIGGKVGINFHGVKNLVGSFNQPIGVICDISTLKTLPDREFAEGFGEVIKHGLIFDKKYFEFVTSKKPREFSEEELLEIVAGSCKIKANIVGSDEKEEEKRKLLNFGHTIGHAIEAVSLKTENPILHGEAIGLGMVAEGYISMKLGLITADDLEIIKSSLVKAGLLVKYESKNIEELIEKTKSDKKTESGVVKWTLLQSLGEAIINQGVTESLVKESLKYLQSA
jgi:3-dehydroquinate synthase